MIKIKLYTERDIEFWIRVFKMKYYGGSWPRVHEYVLKYNREHDEGYNVPPFYTGMIPPVQRYFERRGLNYDSLIREYGNYKGRGGRMDEEILYWINIYEDPDFGGSINCVREFLFEIHGYVLGETTIRRDIQDFFKDGKYLQYKGINFSYKEWIKKYQKPYIRENMFLDKRSQANEYILVHDVKRNILQRYTLVDFKGLENINDFFIYGFRNEFHPTEVRIESVVETHSRENIELICKHGSILISPHQIFFTIDEDCNIIEIHGNMITEGTPLLMPRYLNVEINNDFLDLGNCGRIFLKNGIEYIEQFNKTAKRFIIKDFWLGFILGQYVAEGTMGSNLRPTTALSSSTEFRIAKKVKNLAKQLFGLTFNLNKTRVKKCKNCGTATRIINDDANSCLECKSIFYKQYVVATKKRLAQCIFTKGLNLKPLYSYLKEVPPIIYNAPADCIKGFLFGFFLGDGSRRDYRHKGGTFDLNFETSSRRLIFGLKFLLKRLGVISTINEHEPTPERENSKVMYSLIIRGSSNYQILKEFLNFLPSIDYTTTDIKTSVNTQEFMRKLNAELQKIHRISLGDLNKEGLIPKNAVHVATQVQRKTNLSEHLLLKTLDGLKGASYMTPIARRMEAIFRENTFTHVKNINNIIFNEEEDMYGISISGEGYCAGTAYIYVKSENNEKRESLYIDERFYHADRRRFLDRRMGRDELGCCSRYFIND